VTLTGPRIALREQRVDDAEALADLIGRPEVFEFLKDDTKPDVEQMRELLRSAETPADDPTRTEYKLLITLDDRAIGLGGLEVKNTHNRLGEIGYALHPDHWGKGYATEAANLLLTFGFDTLGLHRIEATTRPDNRASYRLMERIGMRREGLRRRDLLLRGEWRDSVLYAILEDDPRP